MRINERCLPCLVNQAINTAKLTNAKQRDVLYKKIFASMSEIDFLKTNPEIVGENYRLLKKHLGCDDPLGTILSRNSDEFLEIYKNADVIIAKGQANFESLSEEKENIYFLLMVKCAVIAEYIGTEQKSLVCMKNCK